MLVAWRNLLSGKLQRDNRACIAALIAEGVDPRSARRMVWGLTIRILLGLE
jgi:hypothetical protein